MYATIDMVYRHGYMPSGRRGFLLMCMYIQIPNKHLSSTPVPKPGQSNPLCGEDTLTYDYIQIYMYI
jgi:hypothetical protein